MDRGKRTCQRNVPVRGLVGNVDVLNRTSVQTAVCVTLKQIGKGSADPQEKMPTQVQYASWPFYFLRINGVGIVDISAPLR